MLRGKLLKALLRRHTSNVPGAGGAGEGQVNGDLLTFPQPGSAGEAVSLPLSWGPSLHHEDRGGSEGQQEGS